MKKKVVSFLVSGRGTNFKIIAEKIIDEKINAHFGIVISDKGDAKALDIANDLGIKAYFVNPASCANRRGHEEIMVRLLRGCKTDLIVGAGYMRVLTPYFVKKFRNRIINIHPALLPSFPGVNAQKQAFDKGVKITGCTTHFIDEGVDTGPIIMQAAVPVLDNDTVGRLSSRILAEEYKILPESVSLFCEDKLRIFENRVIIGK